MCIYYCYNTKHLLKNKALLMSMCGNNGKGLEMICPLSFMTA